MRKYGLQHFPLPCEFVKRNFVIAEEKAPLENGSPIPTPSNDIAVMFGGVGGRSRPPPLPPPPPYT